MIKIVNFPFCNYYSLQRYLRVRGLPYQHLSDPSELHATDRVVLPGVGTFGQGMGYLANTGLIESLRNHAASGGHVLGICLGMQMLLNSSSETPGVEGLGLIEGSCQRIPLDPIFSVPHIGWNEISANSPLHPCLDKSFDNSPKSLADFYFVHSYYACPVNQDSIIATFKHPQGGLAAAVAVANVIGFQFHPEKSGAAGYALLDQALTV